MRWSIGNQILFPFAGVLAVSVATIAVASAWIAARSQEAETVERLQRVVATLGHANFPYTTNVLEQMRGLSGADFIALADGNRVVASTVPMSSISDLPPLPLVRDVDSFTQYQTIELRGTRYLAARVMTPRASSLLILYPERRRVAARRTAVWPPLAIGAATAVAMAAVSIWLSRRIGRRINAVRGLFARIAAGDFSHAGTEATRDELHDLVSSANQLSDQLQAMQQTIQHTERVRLLAQLAGGLAHQLRNSLTGARMAVQLHQRSCLAPAPRDDLEVALRQLVLTEEQVKGLLALGSRSNNVESKGSLSELLQEVSSLVGPAARHAHVDFELHDDVGDLELSSFEQLRASLLNLVLNAIEAASPGGSVGVHSTADASRIRIEVRDSGPGPPAHLHDSLFEPFATSKPEGIGLGLALARQTAEGLGGSLTWSRRDAQTVFALDLPRPQLGYDSSGAMPPARTVENGV